MDELKQQIDQLATAWNPIYETVKSNPALLTAQLPGAKPEQINELVQTLVKWVGLSRAPRGFHPGFHVARAAVSHTLPTAQTATTRLAAGEYTIFPGFVSSLGQIASSFHMMMVFSDRDQTRETVAELGGRLSESLSLIDTAQSELAKKAQELEHASAALAQSQVALESAKRSDELAKRALEQAEHSSAKTVAARDEAIQAVNSILEAIESATALENSNTALQLKLNKQAETLEDLSRRTQSQQKLIEQLLPKGASAGLASAFALRVRQVERTKWIWLSAFVLSVAGLALIAYGLLKGATPTGAQVWWELLHRVPLAAPFIWLGWFSAIQYGNVVRLQEDYAFKEATSKAFAGYKDHLEHMATVEVAEAKTALKLMSERTIEILAREPLRIYGKAERDAAPTHSMLDTLAKMLRRHQQDEKGA